MRLRSDTRRTILKEESTDDMALFRSYIIPARPQSPISSEDDNLLSREAWVLFHLANGAPCSWILRNLDNMDNMS